MLETSRLCQAIFGLLVAGCAVPAREVAATPPPAPKAASIAPFRDDAALAEEAKALLAQAETDVQRARAKRALWLRAWEDLLSARRAMASSDAVTAIWHAKRASELAQLGLEQLAYPAVQ